MSGVKSAKERLDKQNSSQGSMDIAETCPATEDFLDGDLSSEDDSQEPKWGRLMPLGSCFDSLGWYRDDTNYFECRGLVRY